MKQGRHSTVPDLTLAQAEKPPSRKLPEETFRHRRIFAELGCPNQASTSEFRIKDLQHLLLLACCRATSLKYLKILRAGAGEPVVGSGRTLVKNGS